MPRSYSRELAERFTGNRRYFRNWNSFENNKIHLCHLAMAGVAIWGAFLFFGGSRADYHVTHGPVAKVHATWDNQCDTCHKTQGLSDHRLLDAHGRWHDLTCAKCHSGPLHHNNLIEESPPAACSSCHHDHNGRDHSLVKISDDHCTRCHEDLKKFQKDKSVPVVNITHFVKDHPEFKPLEKPTRHLNFSHAQHMTPGMPLAVGQKDPLTFDRASDLKLDMAAMEKYRTPAQKLQKSGSDLVTMACQNCHTPNVDGKLFQAINYEQHCAVCHPTTVFKESPPGRGVTPWFTVDHGKQPEAYEAILKAKFSVLLQENHPQLKNFPGNTAGDPVMAAFDADVKSTTAKAKQSLFTSSCKLCHEGLPEKVIPPAIPTVWLKTADYNHVAHRAVDCVACHLDANKRVGDSGFESIPHAYKAPKVDIAGLESCKTCHSPAHTVDGKVLGGIRHGCTDCHGYHQVDRLHKRQNDMIYYEKNPLSVQEFLRGKGHE